MTYLVPHLLTAVKVHSIVHMVLLDLLYDVLQLIDVVLYAASLLVHKLGGHP